MALVKMYLNAIVSSKSRFGTIDIKDFYLGADMPSHDRPSLKIYVDMYSASLLAELQLTEFVQLDKQGKPFVYADIVKTIAGLKQSGLLSQNRLVTQLNKHDYYQTATPMLFRHRTRNIDFTLVVDDFGIQYTLDEDLDHLIHCLEELYEIKIERTGNRFLGFDIDYDMSARTITMSYPGYLATLLASVCPRGVKGYDSPSIYTAPIFGSTAPQITPVDSTAPASTADSKKLQRVVGSILYYARAIDHLMLPAVCNLATFQSRPTKQTMCMVDRLLGYASTHLNGTVVIRPSDMILRIHSDASHLSRSNSGSVAGGIHYLGTSDPYFINAPIHCHSTGIPVVCAAVSESEYAGVFSNAQIAVDERNCLASLGYPQPPTVVFCDNECAVGLANETVRAKKSKSIDMRFDWIRDRVKQLQLIVDFIPGALNLADFFQNLSLYIVMLSSPLYTLPTLTLRSLTPYYSSCSFLLLVFATIRFSSKSGMYVLALS